MNTAETQTTAGIILTTLADLPFPENMPPVAVGRALADTLFDTMSEAGLAVRDSLCVLVCASGNELAGCAPFTAEHPDVSDLEMQRLFLSGRLEPLGLLFGIMDRECGALRLHVRGFAPDERTTRLLAHAMALMESGDMKTPRYN